MSDGWLAFAVENGSDGLQPERILGRSLWDFISGAENRQLYRHLFARAREMEAPISVPFRCDAPEFRRFMRLTIEPTKDGSLSLSTRLVREEERERVALLDASVSRGDDLVSMCSWCLRILTAPDQ